MALIRNKIKVLVALGTLVLCFLFVAMLGSRSSFRLTDDSTDDSLLGGSLSRFSWGAKSSPETKPKSKLAFATFLSTRAGDDEEDIYFDSARVLAYQLMHAPETRIQENISFIVMVTENVSQRKRDRLAKDGATVIVMDIIPPIKISWNPNWIDQYTKLRLWTLTEYDRILYIDADILLVKPLDGIFDSPVATPIDRIHVVPDKEDESPLPETYLFAGISDTWDSNHGVPMPDHELFNGGFFLMKPDVKMFEHYMSVLKNPDKYNFHEMEQGLLNYVHHQNDNVPWARLEASVWNANLPSMLDYDYGTASLHYKFWEKGDIELQRMWSRVRGQMEGFYLGIEEGNK